MAKKVQLKIGTEDVYPITNFKALWSGSKSDLGQIILNEDNRNYKFIVVRGSRTGVSSQGSLATIPSQLVTGSVASYLTFPILADVTRYARVELAGNIFNIIAIGSDTSINAIYGVN